jgi:hypothetical protein
MWWCPHARNGPKSAINQLASKRHTYYDKAEGVVSETFTPAVNNLKIITTGKKKKISLTIEKCYNVY